MPEAEYGFVSKVLHHLALGQRFIAEASFDIEQATLKPDAGAIYEANHVFVAGLARAGTTLLMRRFYASGAFRSLTYRDMPFVLMPNIWSKLSGASRRTSVRKERAHGDGLMVDYDSPEALEEVFWRVFAREEYLHADCLLPMEADEDLVARFQNYVAGILGHSGKRYLSKNNNNILRLPAIREAFPHALIVIPFRAPLQHADSLRSQHRKFHDERDPFVKHYMAWLAHHEFGADHRRFRFPGELPRHASPDTLEYWVEIWADTYEFLLKTAPPNSLFVGYERFCKELPAVWSSLARAAGLEGVLEDADPVELRQRETLDLQDRHLMDRAERTYSHLQGRMGAWMASVS